MVPYQDALRQQSAEDGVRIMDEIILRGHKVARGKACGGIGESGSDLFLGGVNPETGILVEKGHELEGLILKGGYWCFPKRKVHRGSLSAL